MTYCKGLQTPQPDKYPIPNIDDIFNALANTRFFTTLDLAQGFHQIPIKSEDRPKTVFSTHQGRYKYNCMTFGFINAPTTFQQIINQVLNRIIGSECFVYLNDIIISSESFKTQLFQNFVT
jgi:hypothetical protein